MGTRANYTIEEAMPGDEESIARLIHELAEYEKAPQDCHATPAEVKKHLFGRKKHAECLVARVDGVIVAFALFFTNFSTWKCKPGLYLEDLYVQPAHRKAGIGRALLARLGAICLERDCARMEWAVLEWNELAKAQYRKLGAAPMDEWRTWRLTGDELVRLGREGEALIAAAASEPAAPAPPADPQDNGGRVVIYTDGGAKPNPGVGAWAAILQLGGKTRELVGGEDNTTNNRMELTAVIRALEALKRPCEVELHTDSQYVKNGITSWIIKWKKNNWKRGKGSDAAPVLNVDLWRELDAAAARHSIDFKWVRGHAGNSLNERCDELCSAEIYRRERRGRG